MIRGLLIALAFGLAVAPAHAQQVNSAPSGMVRVLNKTDGNLQDLEIGKGQSVVAGRIKITLQECRYPSGNPAGNAYAYLEMFDQGVETPAYSGWMIASAPALNPLDHPRYDVWVLRCKTS
jgi:hypothetical protein